MEKNNFKEPVESLIKKPIKCSCGKTHKTELSGVLIAEDAALCIPGLVAKYKEKQIFLVADDTTMDVLGSLIVRMIASEGFKVKKFVFRSDEPIVCNHQNLGKLVVALPKDAAIVIAVGAGSIADLAKYLCFKSNLPLIMCPTAASSDSFAAPFSTFFDDNGNVQVFKAITPKAIVADLSVICAAPKDMTKNGISAALSKYISIFDWYLSAMINGTFFCSEIAGYILRELKKLKALVSRGTSLSSKELIDCLLRSLISVGVSADYAGSLLISKGSESSLADYLYHKLKQKDRTVSINLLKGFAACYCVNIYDIMSDADPDFQNAIMEYRGYSWSAYGKEIHRVYDEKADKILSESSGRRFSEAEFDRRIKELEQNFAKIKNDMKKLLPRYVEFKSVFQQLDMPYSFADLGIFKADAVDALEYSFLADTRYGMFAMLWDLAMINSCAKSQTRDIPELHNPPEPEEPTVFMDGQNPQNSPRFNQNRGSNKGSLQGDKPNDLSGFNEWTTYGV